MDALRWLMEWFKSNCDGDWEHGYGIRIETLDNPGWIIKIDLTDTPLEDKFFPTIFENKGDLDWVDCRVEGVLFIGDGDPDKLEYLIEVFRSWASS
jgi:hypothetical protein